MGTTGDRWDRWPRVAAYVIALVLGGAILRSAWLGGSIRESVVFTTLLVAALLARHLWRGRRSAARGEP